LGATFLLSEVVTVAVGMVATSTSKHKWLWPWVPTLHFYYPLATLAALKGLWEMVTKPYYWDKTAHGVHDLGFHEDEAETAAALSPVSPMPHPAPLVLGPAHRIAASASGAATPQKSAHPLILYPADKPRQNSQEIGADRVRAFGEAPRAFVFERLEQDASGSVPRPGRRLTFGLDFEGTSNTPALRRALEAAAVAFDPERLRPAPKPDPKPDSETVRPDHTETVLALRHQIKDPTPRIPVNSAGAPEWAHMAAFVEVPAFLPTTPAIEPRRLSGTSGDPEEA